MSCAGLDGRAIESARGLAAKGFMKAIVVGPCLSDFDPGYNAAVGRALEGHGYQVRIEKFYVPTPPGLRNRIRIDAGLALGHRKYLDAYVSGFNAAVLEQFRNFRPDLVLVIRGTPLQAEILSEMHGAVRVLWVHDRISRCDLSPEQIRAYDHHFVFEGTDVQWLRDNMGLAAKFLPMGYDPFTYRPMANVPRDVDLSFIGAYYPKRRQTLERLARDFRGRKLRFYGRNVRYREPKTWLKAASYVVSYGATFVNRSLDAPAINHLYARSKICLNMHHEQSQLGCNPRVFEIMGAGAFQLVDAIPFVREHLGGVVATYTDYESLGSAIEASLNDRSLREQRAEMGRDLALREHTFGHRVKQILQHAELQTSTSEQRSG
jgi:spore maturation protein CgeB